MPLKKRTERVDRAVVEDVGERGAEHHAREAEADADQAREGNGDLQKFAFHRFVSSAVTSDRDCHIKTPEN